MRKIKTVILNIMITTGATLIILAIFFTITNNTYISTHTVLEILFANIVINFGILITSRFESRYMILEYLLDVSYVIVVLIVFGTIFNWYSVPVWVLCLMAVVVYVFMVFFATMRIKKDVKEMNELLQKRRTTKK